MLGHTYSRIWGVVLGTSGWAPARFEPGFGPVARLLKALGPLVFKFSKKSVGGPCKPPEKVLGGSSWPRNSLTEESLQPPEPPKGPGPGRVWGLRWSHEKRGLVLGLSWVLPYP